MPGTEAEAQSVLHTCFGNEHLSLLKSREGKEAFHKSWLREIMLEHGSPLKQWGGGDKCVCGDEGLVIDVSLFPHYLQGSPGEGGVPGRDGLKGEKVDKLQIKFSPQRKIWSYDVLSQVEHARQLEKTHFRSLALRAILNHVVTLCSRLWCLWLCCFLYIRFFSCGRAHAKRCAERGKVLSWHAYLMGFVTCQNKRSCTQDSPPTGVTLLHSGAEK